MESTIRPPPDVATASDVVDEQPRKRSRGDASAPAAVDLRSIPTSDAILTARLRRELLSAWGADRVTSAAPPSTAAQVAAVVPPFKVGTLEMYRRFPEAYDLLMQHHDCSAVHRVLVDDVLGRIAASATGAAETATQRTSPTPPWVRVADFGCGTGRIGAMVAQHPAVQGICAYDSETAMLRRCLLNTVRSAARSASYTGVVLLPVATEAGEAGEAEGGAHGATDTASSSSSSPPVLLCGTDDGGGAAARHAPATLQLCLRPVSYEAVQAGFLAAPPHRRCHLVVCAWSLSYVMRMQWGNDHWHAAVDAVVESLIGLLDNRRSDAALVIVETLGNGAVEPTRNNTYTRRLEERFGFERAWVRTDYVFDTAADATRLVQFFFGPKMLSNLTTTDGDGRRLMECTGIWTLWRAREAAPAPL